MAEKIVSPGVFTKEIDASFLPSAIGDIGAAIIGPTVKGPALIPTVVTSYAEYQAKFGDVFKSGSNSFTYLTSITAQNYLRHSGKLTVVRILDGTFARASANIPSGSGLYNTGSAYPGGAEAGNAAGHSVAEGEGYTVFTLNTHAHGATLNNTGSLGNTNNILKDSGSKDNIRWEISQVNPTRGTFTLLIRRGDDVINRKQIVETWNNISMDPNSNNYIGQMIGDQVASINGQGGSDPFISYTGNYPNKSKYVYVSNIRDTVDYLNENGAVRVPANSASLPGLGSGSYDGSFGGGGNGVAGFDSIGNVVTSSGTTGAIHGTQAYNFYSNINGSNSQGYALQATTNNDGGQSYIDALNLLSNADEYDINMILIPGIVDRLGGAHTGIISKAIDVCETRGDAFLIYDVVEHGKGNLKTVTSQAGNRDSNYAATYWPWVQINESNTGQYQFVPPSVVMAGIYAFNDKVAAPWFAPAGLNRGGLDTVVQAERKLTHANRDELYESNVNPIATFPGQGVVVWGQKTLQKKASALDRVNVRRLMIKVKKFIAASSRFLVFEQNNSATRARFLNITNPYLEQVQAQSGLNAFRVVMDESNNTPDVVDRNILYGQIFLQPTRTAEFIVLDFTIQPTGATFPE